MLVLMSVVWGLGVLGLGISQHIYFSAGCLFVIGAALTIWPKLQRRASDYMKDRIWHGFIDDTAAIPAVGASQVLWSSDFPHIRSIGLEAQSVLHDQLQFLPQEDQDKVVGGNAAALFQLN